MPETIVQDIVDPCADPSCERTATKQVYVTFDRGYLTRLSCDEHVSAAEAWLLEHRPKDWV